jgi:hypothetical protein
MGKKTGMPILDVYGVCREICHNLTYFLHCGVAKNSIASPELVRLTPMMDLSLMLADPSLWIWPDLLLGRQTGAAKCDASYGPILSFAFCLFEAFINNVYGTHFLVGFFLHKIIHPKSIWALRLVSSRLITQSEYIGQTTIL